MFTGLVEDVGKLLSRSVRGPGARLRFGTKLFGLQVGESVSVMGACLSVDAICSGGFESDVSGETVMRTTLGKLAVDQEVHLERAVRVGDRLGGHILTGHVDGTIRLVDRTQAGEFMTLSFAFDPSLSRLLAPKGSVGVDGVSLTINEVRGHQFSVVLVPRTQRATLLGNQPIGALFNVEVDVLARYVGRRLEAEGMVRAVGAPNSDQESVGADDALLSRLASSGFL